MIYVLYDSTGAITSSVTRNIDDGTQEGLQVTEDEFALITAYPGKYSVADGVLVSIGDAAYADILAADAAAMAANPSNIADTRFAHEVAGMTVAGMTVYTDRATQSKLTAAALRATRDSTYTLDWKLSTGTFATLTAEQILAVADAVGDYVQACYSREAELLAAVSAGTFTEAMLLEGWPAQS